MIKTVISLPPKTIIGYRKNGNPIFNIAGGSEPGDFGGNPVDPIGSSGYDGGEPQGDISTGGINPSWNQYLESVPQEHRDYVIPAFREWDKGVQEKFNKVHQQYEPLKPWQKFAETGIDVETAEFALRLLNGINENPEMVYKAIGDFYKFNSNGSDSGQGQDGLQTEDVNSLDPRIAQIERQNQIIAQHMLRQQEEAQVQQAEAQLDQELNSARKKFGNFDEEFVLAHMQIGMSAEQAAEKYKNLIESQAAKYGVKPLIMGSGGGTPQFNTDVRKLSDKDARSLVVQTLQQHAAERNK